MSLRSALPDRVRRDEGYTMITVVVTMFILGLFSVAAWSAANGDLRLSRGAQDRQAAYEAADSGIQWFLRRLQADNLLWRTCAPTADAGFTLAGGSSAPRWRAVNPSETGGQRFAVEIVPVAGKTCAAGAESTALLDNGVLKVRSTGIMRGKRRQIVATLRRGGFTDSVWYTVREVSPPAVTGSPTWWKANCDKPRRLRPSDCDPIWFVTGDNLQGPMHTEDDSFAVDGTPTFGRDKNDKIEVAGPGANDANWKYGDMPRLLGTLVAPAESVKPPVTNAALSQVSGRLEVSGNTCLRLNGTTVTYWQKQTGWGTWPNTNRIACSGTGVTVDIPASGLIWVANNTTCPDGGSYSPTYQSSTCGNVAVWGTYTKDVTIGAANDVIVYADITRGSANPNALAGLVANQFVRMYHPTQYGENLLAKDSHPHMIQASVLATQGSMLVDNWDRGAGLGTLSMRGSIAQYWRGAVGTSGGTGYIKDYQYDDRLRYRRPPYFPEDESARWTMVRQSEGVPCRGTACTAP